MDLTNTVGFFYFRFQMESCKNCNATLNGNYCSQCGQKHTTGRIFFSDVKDDFFTYFIDLSSPLPRTAIGMLTQPGKLIRRYIKGERKKFYQPVQYFVLSVAFYYFVRWLTQYDPVDIGYQLSGATPPDPAQMNLREKTSVFMSKHVNLLLFLLIGISSGFFRLFFRKAEVNYTEYLVFGFYTVGQFIQLSVITIFLTQLSPKFLLLNYLLIFLYPAWAMYGFQEKKKWVKTLATIPIMAISFFFYVVISFMGSYFLLRLVQ